MKTLPLSEVKAKLSGLVDEIAKRDERVVITKHGRPAAMLLSMKDIEGLEATLDIMQFPAFYAEVLQAIKDADAGKIDWIDLDDLDENFEFKEKKKDRRSRRAS